MTRKHARQHELEKQGRRLEKKILRLEGLSRRYSWFRLGLFIVGLGLILAAFYFVNGWLGWPAVLAGLLVFNVVAYFHRRVDRSLARHRGWLKIKQTHLARMRLDWPAIPGVEPLPARAEHPFALDLDLVGERSIHQLLNTAASREGTERLRQWLLNARPEAGVIEQRQALVRELSPLPRFRDRLALTSALGAEDRAGPWEGQKLLKWLDKRANTSAVRGTLLALAGLAGFNIGCFVLSRLGLAPNLWLFTWPVYFLAFIFRSKDTGQLYDDAFALRQGLGKLGGVLRFLETFRYGRHPHLQKLVAPYLEPGRQPSRYLRRLEWLAGGAALQKNPILWLVVNALVPWDFFFADRLNQARAGVATRLPVWLDIWYELEALNSLANFTYLNPDYTFPRLAPAGQSGAMLRGQNLGHPLIEDDTRVCNDFALDQPGQIVIITGSNMAGKSSFLRTLGVNLALSYAGGPVNATLLHTSLFRLFTCIRVSDSVTDGYSYFYAEVRRLKALLDELERADSRPLFFLIDEIFRGTNNRERLTGSRSYLRALAGRNGLGVVSTHDLDLVKLADELPLIENYHFREEVVDGQMVFDYKLRPGPSPTTNALKIMKLAGLPVESRDEARR